MSTAHASLPHRTTRITTTISLVLAVLKRITGLYTGSVAVFASAMDSFFDFLVSGFNSFAAHSAEKPHDDAYNYGRGKMEGLAATTQGLLVLVTAIFIGRQAVLRLFHPHPLSVSRVDLAMIAMILSALAALGITLYLENVRRRTRSLVVAADALHYRTDVYSNGAVFLAMILVRSTGWTWIDPMLGIGIALYIAKECLPLLRQGFDMLMDRSLPDPLVEQIRSIAVNHSPLINGAHELKTRRSGDINFVELHLVFDEEIPLGQAHRIADEIEMRIRTLEEAKWSINIHLDPLDDSPRDRRLAGFDEPAP